MKYRHYIWLIFKRNSLKLNPESALIKIGLFLSMVSSREHEIYFFQEASEMYQLFRLYYLCLRGLENIPESIWTLHIY